MAESLTGPITDALRRMRSATGVSLAFGGVAHDVGGLRLRHFVGDTVGAMNGVGIDVGQGLGGKVVALSRPVVVDDYLRTPRITHLYNAIIEKEGLRAMAAAPVIVARKPVAVLYGALRSDAVIGDRTLDVLAIEARALEQQIVASRATVAAAATSPDTESLRTRLAQAYAELRTLARSVGDAAISGEIARITETLLDDAPEAPPLTELTRRELDVLALAAIGYTNARIAEELGIGVHTAKGYVKDALRKLGASSRLEAVVIGRRAGLLP